MSNGPHVDFLKTMAMVQHAPEPEGGPGTFNEFPSRLPPLGQKETIVSPQTKQKDIAVKAHVVHFSKVFVIWRPFEECPRCKKAIDAEEVILPSDGDYVCTHNQNAEYKSVMDRCYSGKGVIMLRELFNLPNGNRVVHVEWCEEDPAYAKEREEKARLAKELAPSHGMDSGVSMKVR